MSFGMLVNIDVDDLGKAETFYTQAFDLKVGRRFGDDGLELLGGSSPVYLLLKQAGSRAAKAAEQRRDYARHWTPVHLDFTVPDIQAAIRRALAAGATLENEVRSEYWGHIAVLADPFGHGFCLIEFRNRGYDEIATS